MRRLFSIVLTAAVATGAGLARADVETWRPPAIFTKALCDQELGNGLSAFKAKLAEAEIETPADGDKDKKKIAAYGDFLRKTAAAVKTRAGKQGSAAGKWRGKTLYESLRWRGKDYHLTSCQFAKKKIPLKRALRVATAAAEPTPVDLQLAETIETYIKVKKSRAKCRKLRPYTKARKCLKKYGAYEWLDRYPLN